MMKKASVRWLAMAAAAVMACAGLAGCGGSGGPADSSAAPVSAQSDGNSTTATEDEFNNLITGGESTTATGDSNVSSKPGSGTTRTTTVQTTTPKAVETPQSEEIYKSIKGTTIEIPVFAEPEEDVLARQKAFEERYSCKVHFTVYGWNDWRTKLMQLVGSKKAPDLTPVFDEQFITYVCKNVIQPIESFVDKKAPNWDPDLLSLYTWGGKLYSVATSAAPITIYYNKDMFEDKGLEDPYKLYKAGKWDFDKFRETAKALTAYNGEKMVTIGFATWIWDVFCLANGSTGISLEKAGQIDITLGTQANLKGLELIQKMVREDKSYSPALKADSNFQAGKVGMIAERAYYAIGAYDLYNEGSFELGWVPLPKGPNVSGEVAPAIVESFGVPVGAANPKGGMAWVYYGAVRAAQLEQSKDPEYMESFHKTWSDEHYGYYKDYMSRAKLVCSFINGVGNWYPSKRWGMWEEIFEKGTPPATAVEKHKSELQYEIDTLLKK